MELWNISRVERAALRGLAHRHACKVNGKERMITALLTVGSQHPFPLVDAILLLGEALGSQLIDGKVIVKDSLADGIPLDVLNILPKEEGRHLFVAVLQRTPALDQDVALGQPAAERHRAQLVVHEEFVEVVLVVLDGVLPGSDFDDLFVGLVEGQRTQQLEDLLDGHVGRF